MHGRGTDFLFSVPGGANRTLPFFAQFVKVSFSNSLMALWYIYGISMWFVSQKYLGLLLTGLHVLGNHGKSMNSGESIKGICVYIYIVLFGWFFKQIQE